MDTEIKELKAAFQATQESLNQDDLKKMEEASQRLTAAVEGYDKKVKNLKRVSVPTGAGKTRKTNKVKK